MIIASLTRVDGSLCLREGSRSTGLKHLPVKKAWMWGARGEWAALMTPLLLLHSAGTWQQQRSEVLGWRSGTSRCPEDGRGRDKPRGWATGLAHRHRPHTIGECARRRRYGVAHVGW